MQLRTHIYSKETPNLHIHALKQYCLRRANTSVWHVKQYCLTTQTILFRQPNTWVCLTKVQFYTCNTFVCKLSPPVCTTDTSCGNYHSANIIHLKQAIFHFTSHISIRITFKKVNQHQFVFCKSPENSKKIHQAVFWCKEGHSQAIRLTLWQIDKWKGSLYDEWL